MYIGTSGWKYARWRGDFYPAGLRQRDELTYLSQRMNSAEINGSFYSLQTPERYANWCEQTPADFFFAVKGGYVTHLKQLHDPITGLANFFASGPLALGTKLGPFLWQLPARLPFDERAEPFLDALPRTTADADHLVQHATRGDYQCGLDHPLRHAIEPRHPSWRDCAPLLRKYNVALVCADTAGVFPEFDELTADFAYFRLHGPQKLYFGSYSDQSLQKWRERMPQDRPSYVYFDNDADGAAPWNAIRLSRLEDPAVARPAHSAHL